MKINKEVREYLRELRKKATAGLWGRLGYWHNGRPPAPIQNPLETAPGLSIGSVEKYEPIARFNGYEHDVAANADYVTVIVNHMDDLLNELDELEEENRLLKELLQKVGGKN